MDRLTFYFGVVAVICATLFLGYCTHTVQQCRSEAIKANMPADKIRQACGA